jgi:hypothetical protein
VVITRHQFLAYLHEQLQPRGYLEIGVHQGDSLILAQCPALGVDPEPALRRHLRPNERVAMGTSDHVFANAEREALGTIDLAFIDGMHLFEFALRDFIGVETWANMRTVVVFDDVLPRNQGEAAREQCPGDWTGDVWKVTNILRQYRPDLEMRLVDTTPTGTLVVWDLDPGNQTLQDKYDMIMDMGLEQFNEVPDDVINRTGASSPYDVLEELLAWQLTVKGQG